MGQNISDIQKWLELEKRSAIYRHTDVINSILVEHPELSEAFGLTRQDAFAYLIIGEFQRLFHLRKVRNDKRCQVGCFQRSDKGDNEYRMGKRCLDRTERCWSRNN